MSFVFSFTLWVLTTNFGLACVAGVNWERVEEASPYSFHICSLPLLHPSIPFYHCYAG